MLLVNELMELRFDGPMELERGILSIPIMSLRYGIVRNEFY